MPFRSADVTRSDVQERAAIPVIDLHSENAVTELLKAACDHGFIFIKNDGIDLKPSEVEQMFHMSRDFFARPPVDKASCRINSKAAGKNHGWLSKGTETLDPAHHKKGDYKEAFNIGEYIDGRPQQPFPSPLDSHEKEIGMFVDKCHALCRHILTLLAKGLRIAGDAGGSSWFSARHDGPSGSVLRLLFYPSLPDSSDYNPEEDVRAGAHSDYGSVTLLFRFPSQPGLEILTQSGSWAPVPVDPNPSSGSNTLPILVNLGDIMSYWTGGLLKSTVHRVVFPKSGEGPQGCEDRYSIAYFCHPEDDAQLTDIPSPIVQAHRSQTNFRSSDNHNGKVVTARDHLNSRLAATYGVS